MHTKFAPSIQQLLNSKSIEEEQESIDQLILIYSSFISSLSIGSNGLNETSTNNGTALSPKHAADCLDDKIRSARFLKGVHKSIIKAIDRKKKTPIEVVYAGCGPLGTLIIPLLHLFEKHQIQITILDIHQESITSVSSVIERFELTGFFRKKIQGDAITYKHDKPIDLLITETMDKGLTKEPQVAITQNLTQQLSEDGILIPSSIAIYYNHDFFGNLPQSHKTNSKISGLPANAKRLFVVDKNLDITPFHFESNYIEIEDDISQGPDSCIYTEVTIFEDIHLRSSEAYITNPICPISLSNIDGDKYQLIYESTGTPNWSIKK